MVLFGSFFPFDFDFIYLVLAWTQLGSMWRLFGALCERLVQSREFIFLLMRPFHFTVRSERVAAAHRRFSDHSVSQRGPTCNRQREREGADELRQSLTSEAIRSINEGHLICFKMMCPCSYKVLDYKARQGHNNMENIFFFFILG